MKNIFLTHILLSFVIMTFAQTPVTLVKNLEYPKGLWVNGNTVYFTETAGRNTNDGGKICLDKYNLTNNKKTILINNPVNSDALIVTNDGKIYLSSYQHVIPGEFGKISVVDPNTLIETHLYDIEIATTDMFLDSLNNILLIGSSSLYNAKSLYVFSSLNHPTPKVVKFNLGGVTCVSKKDSIIYFSDNNTIKYFGSNGMIKTFYNKGAYSISLSARYLYYADPWKNNIGRINLKTKVDETLLSGLNSPLNVRFDNITNNLYFLEAGTNSSQFKDGTLKVIPESSFEAQNNEFISKDFLEKNVQNLPKTENSSHVSNAYNPDELTEITRHLQNNQLYGPFIYSSDGSCYLTYEDCLYSKNDRFGDSWGQIAKSIRCVSIDANNPNLFYAIRPNNNVVKSLNRGVNWITIQNGLPGDIIPINLIINPHNNSEIFLTTRTGIYKTTDAGFSWQAFKTEISTHQFIINTKNKNIFYLKSEKGISLSLDEGLNWKIISNTLPKILVKGTGRTAVYRTIQCYKIIYTNYDENAVIIAITEKGIFKTTNDGNSWSEFNVGFSNTERVYSVLLSDTEIYLGCGVTDPIKSNSTPVIYKTDLSFTKWVRLDINFSGTGFQEITGIYKDRSYTGFFIKANDKIAYIDKKMNIIGLNYGVTQHSIVHAFNISENGDNTIQYAIVENNNYVDVDKYGIWKSYNNGLSWNKLLIYDHYSNWASSSFRKILISPYNPFEIWSFDNDYNNVSYDGGNTWLNIYKYYNVTQISNAKFVDFSFDPKNQDIIYFTAGVNDYFLYRFDKKTAGSTRLCQTGSKFKVAGDNSNKILTSWGNLSTDGGWTWNSIKGQLNEFNGGYDDGGIIPINLNSQQITVWIPHKGIFASSNDDGKSWNWKSIVYDEVTNLYVDSKNSANIIITQKTKVSDYGDYNGLNILYSTDCGKSFKVIFRLSKDNMPNYSSEAIISKDFLNDFIQSLYIGQIDNINVIYLGLSKGMIYSKDEGKTWVKIGGINENM